ncbi:S-layer homology domain-containing protein [Paenibacillus thalictri]|uniref:C-type cytochrome n=1 Tax=Paenibacillus thalictri TaxID=2527873 RepID=A0A4Q9DSK1_9BACL|nr:S-layer homology domain-containing protein [Paenibacillus thalictri]TBL78239.1 c-type cytochrome [Paenibacillus thalictri]
MRIRNRHIPAAMLAVAAISSAIAAASLNNDNSAAASAAIPAPDGQALYEQHCLACHGTDARGMSKYPSLIGSAKTKNFDRAYSFISQNMPQNAPGSLKEDEYKAITKYVLSLNGVPTDFSDIDSHWARQDIVELFDKKYVDGYTVNGKLLYKPDQHITRAEFVRYLVKAKELYLSNSDTAGLTDIDSLKNNKIYIITAVENGLVDGYPDHTFKPNNPITRAEIAVLLARSELLSAGAADRGFQDIPHGYWAEKAIFAVQQAKLFDGYEDGSFRPDNKMTRGEAAAVIKRLVDAP